MSINLLRVAVLFRLEGQSPIIARKKMTFNEEGQLTEVFHSWPENQLA
ncbi:hypothetical protein V0M98_37900 (plasmid) [Pseudomonas silesiensis]